MNTKEIRQIRLVEALAEFGDTARAFADGVAAPENFISQCKYGRRPVPDDLARRIEGFMGWDPFWMDTQPEHVYPTNESGGYKVESQGNVYHINGEPVTPIKKYAVSKVPVFSLTQVSEWRKHMDNYKTEGTNESLFAPDSHGADTFAIKMPDDSMTNPTPGGRSYHQGVFLYVDPHYPASNNRVVVAKLGENATPVVRLFLDDGINKQLIPLNREIYKPVEFDENAHTIIGVVTGTYQPE